MTLGRLRSRGMALVAGFTVSVLTGVMVVNSPGAAHAAVTGFVRVDQVGFLSTETKQAYLMTSGSVSGATFSVVDSSGSTVQTGNVGSASRGSWNSSYPDVYPIDFSGLTTSGTYHIQVSGGGVSASSPGFVIETAASLYGKLVSDGVNFFQVQRDGPNVIAGTLNRQPSHLNDESANVYANPHFASGGSDTITDSNLTKIGGPVDVSGGWFDAGDYLKFTFTTAYADAILFAAQRALGSAAPASLAAEAHYGEQWLNKMWNQSTKTLYIQVGIGSGNSAGTFTGDHDLWRLPQADDGDTASVDRFSAAHRPVFEAAPPGSKISPDLAGRVAAAFAMAAQVDATSNPAQAAAEYQAATSVYAMANTSSPPNPLTTTLPNAYYPESIWHDDMELGAAEIALAGQALGNNVSTYLSQAATWASDYIASDTGDTFNLYDVSALAHADLIQAMANAGNPSGLAVTKTALVNDLKRQVQSAATTASSDIFHAGGDYTNFDVDSHTFGFLTTEALYQAITGDTSYATFATEQRDWLMGANAWGTSFMVGEGATFPHCMQHQVANLSGSLNGTAPIATGAVVNGPNGSSNFSGGLGSYQSGMVKCPSSGADPFSAFDGHGSMYVDDVRSWQSSEPALDMTGGAVLGSALQEALNGTSTPPNDFSLAVSPASGTVSPGASASTTVTTAVTSGSAEPVTLTASGLPSGATASFSTSPVTSGGTSTMTVNSTSSTPAGTYPITVTGTAASGSHSTTYTLTVSSGGGSCTPGQLLGNPGFENGSTTAPWTESSTLGFNPITQATSAEPAHSGSWEAWLNGNGTADTDTIAQSVAIPGGCTAVLSFWLHVDTTENTTANADDTLKVQLLNGSGTVLTTLATFSNLNAASGYQQHSYDVSAYAGQTVTVKFTGTETDTNGGTTDFVIDDTALNTTSGGGGGGCTPGQLLGNPGFENGSTTAPWTESSTLGFNPITQATSAEPAHSGSWEAWLNGNGTADTDTIAQSVAIPGGCTAVLSFWLHVDTTENTTANADDTLKVQLLNGSGTVLTTLATFSNLNAASGYQQHSYDVSAYAGQTVTVKFTGTETDTNGGTTDFVIDDTALNTTSGGGGGGCTPGQLLGNPGFENGSTTAPWTESSTLGFNPITQATSAEPAHSGSWEAWLNGNGTADTDTIAQSVAIPGGCTAVLSFWLHADTTENTTANADDTLKVQLLNGSGTVLTTLATFSNLNAASGYQQHSYDVSAYAGQTVTVKFTGTETDTNGGTTDFVIDDTALNTTSGGSPTCTPAQLLGDPGFENGATITPWTESST